MPNGNEQNNRNNNRDKAGRESAGGGIASSTITEFLIGAIIVLVVANAVGQRLRAFVLERFSGRFSPESLQAFFNEEFFPIFKVISSAVTALLIVAIAIVVRRLTAIRTEERRSFAESLRDIISPVEEIENERWQRVDGLSRSKNPNDWKVAIMEADIILDEMLGKMGYHGETLSDKLKSIEKSDFVTIDKAWEAHKIRNAIAHQGGEFLVNEREARRVIGLFKEVFEEFKYI